MEYLIVRGRLKLVTEDARAPLAALVEKMNGLLEEEGARLTAGHMVIRYEGVVGSSREIADVLREIAHCIRAAAVVVRQVRWETTLSLRRQTGVAVRAPR